MLDDSFRCFDRESQRLIAPPGFPAGTLTRAPRDYAPTRNYGTQDAARRRCFADGTSFGLFESVSHFAAPPEVRSRSDYACKIAYEFENARFASREIRHHFSLAITGFSSRLIADYFTAVRLDGRMLTLSSRCYIRLPLNARSRDFRRASPSPVSFDYG